MTLFIALIIGFTSDLAQMNWYLFQLGSTILNMVDHLFPFLLIEILLSKYTFKVNTV